MIPRSRDLTNPGGALIPAPKEADMADEITPAERRLAEKMRELMLAEEAATKAADPAPDELEARS